MADEEEDYMSDAFLLGLDDTRPGLAFGAAAREIKQEAKRKQKDERNKVKPLKQRETEGREKALSNAIDSSNKGFALLQKMGYKEGKGLGKRGRMMFLFASSYLHHSILLIVLHFIFIVDLNHLILSFLRGRKERTDSTVNQRR